MKLLLFALLLLAPAPAAAQLRDVRVVSTNVFIPTLPVFANGKAAFLDYRANAYRVMELDVAGGMETVRQTVFYAEPRVAWSGTHLAWVGYTQGSSQADVYLLPPSATSPTRITNDAAYQNHPVLNGNRLVWQDYRNAGPSGSNTDFYVYDLTSRTTTRLLLAAGYKDTPSLGANHLVWQDFRHAGTTLSTAEVYAWDFVSQREVRLTNGSAYRAHPDIAGNLVVWEDYRNGATGDIYLYDLVAGVEQPISLHPAHKAFPRVSGDWVVWLDYRHGFVAALYGFHLPSETEVPLWVNEAHQDGVALNGDRILWQDYRNGRVDLYAGRLPGLPTSTSREEFSPSLDVFPTLAEERVEIHSGSDATPTSITVVDLQGRVWYERHRSPHVIVSLAGWPSGLYAVCIGNAVRWFAKR